MVHCGNGRRSKEVDVRGPVMVLPHCERLMLCSRRAILLMAGSLPSRAVATMSLCGNTSPPLIMLVNGLQLVCLLQVDELRRNVKICHTERSHRQSRVKFPRRNGGVADFQATKGVRCACEQSRGSALVSKVLRYCEWWYRTAFNVSTLGDTPTAPLPRPPTPHGQRHVVCCIDKTLSLN